MNSGRFKENGGNKAGGSECFRPHIRKSVLWLATWLLCGEMQVIVPSANQVNEVLSRLASNAPPSNAELLQVFTEPPLDTGLDHWSLWTLVCLHKHLDRQRWVAYIVESRLKGDLRQIGSAGAFGQPEALPQSGKVPDEPEWKYFFHGCGCCLTNEVTGVSIDVDFTREGDSGKIDRFFYSAFLLSLSAPEFPEGQIRREEPLQHSSQVEIDRLNAAACVVAEHGLRLTPYGMRIAESIEPLSKQIGQLLEWETPAALRNAVYATLAVGDAILTNQLVSKSDIDDDLKSRIAEKSKVVNKSRLRFLQATLKAKDACAPSYLAALADLGPELSEEIVTSRLFQSPVDGAANTSLEIMRVWNRPNLSGILRELLTRRYKEATGFRSILPRLGFAASKRTDLQPRNYQVTQATLALFQRVRCDSLDSQFKDRVRFLIQNAGGAQAGEAALLIYLLEKQTGLECLRKALSGRVPAAYIDAAAACVVIGSKETKQILKDALSNPNQQIQHTTACALAAFPDEDARNAAQHWFRRNDGIKEPMGKEVTILGRTAPVFTFEDIGHANMDAFFNWSLEKLRKDFKSIL